LRVVEVSFETAQELNGLWHSRLPVITHAMDGTCYAAEYGGGYYAVAIWSLPIARGNNGKGWYELRRMAISGDAPKNTASRMLSVMRKMLKRGRPELVALISYQDTEVHRGTIYKAAGWIQDEERAASEVGWNSVSRVRDMPQAPGLKHRWIYHL